MKKYRAEWPDDDEPKSETSPGRYHYRDFKTLKQAQDFARKKSITAWPSTYVVESTDDYSEDNDAPLFKQGEFKDLRQWVYDNGKLAYKETNEDWPTLPMG